MYLFVVAFLSLCRRIQYGVPPMAVIVVALGAGPCAIGSVVIDFRYDYDEESGGNEFFAPQSKRDLLEAAGSVVAELLDDELLEINPSDPVYEGTNSWQANFNNPTIAPWGGSIGFNINTNWGYAGPDDPPGPGKFDFFSVAMHEIAHILGIGTADSWDTWVDGGQFTGPNAMAANLSSPGDPVGLSGGRDHWAEGTMSLVDG